MQVRILKENDLKEKLETRKLYEQCFDEGKDEYIDYYYDTIIKRNVIVALSDDDCNVVSMVHLNPYLYNVFGKEFLVHYLVAVATDKDYRGHGYMNKVINAAIDYLNTLNEPFCYLVPDTDDLKEAYSRLGFKVVCNFTLDKFSKATYDIYPVRNDEFKTLMEKEQYYLNVETEDYKRDLSSKKVMFKLLNGNLIGINDINEMLDKRIYICQEV